MAFLSKSGFSKISWDMINSYENMVDEVEPFILQCAG